MAVQWSVKSVKDYVDACSETRLREQCVREAEESVGTWVYRASYSFFLSGVLGRAIQRVPPDIAWKVHEYLVVKPRSRIPFDEQLYRVLIEVFRAVEESPATPEEKLHAKRLRELVETALALRSSIERE